MMTVSWVAVLVATVLSFGLGALWYGPFFGKAWIAENGFEKETLMEGFNPGMTYGLTFILAALAAFVFGVFIGEAPGLEKATVWGFVAGLAWVAGAIGTNYLFERRSLKLWLINGGYHTARFTVIGIVFGALG